MQHREGLAQHVPWRFGAAGPLTQNVRPGARVKLSLQEDVMGQNPFTTEHSEALRKPPPRAGLAMPFSGPEIQNILSLIGDGVISTDGSGAILFFNRAAEAIFGYSAEDVIGRPVEVLMPAQYRSGHKVSAARFAASAYPEIRRMGVRREVIGRRRSGEEFPLEATLSRLEFAGEPVLTVVIRDVTERKRREEHQQLIAEELAHRIRNLMTVVMSIVSLTSREIGTVDEFRESLLSRLLAISKANSAVLAAAGQSARLEQLFEAELGPFRAQGTSIAVEGPVVRVNAKVAIALGLVIHELATNAAKYGALSCPGGRLEVSWSVRDAGAELSIRWREREGPPVTKPVKSGFGTEMICRTLAAFGGDTSIHYQPEGFACTLRIPLAKNAAASNQLVIGDGGACP
jgi:PAS domain S-box-containing protein